MPKFIVIAGKKQSGKTTSANHIKKGLLEWRSDLNIHITSFATPIKTFCKDVMGLTDAQIYGTDKEKNSLTKYKWSTLPKEITSRYMHPMPPPKFLTARQVMQLFGTDIMRNFFFKDIWAHAPFDKEWQCCDYVIIDDCRFPNEADVALKNDAILIKLNRDVLGEDVHSSEKALDEYEESKYTHVIPNHYYKNIDCLYKDLDDIVRAERY